MDKEINKILNNMIDKAIVKQGCLICQDNIYIDDKYYLFCCGQYYHEKCLAEYIGLNMYAKCPICHLWITKEIKEAFDIIFDKEYKLDYMREKIKQAKVFTQENSFYNTRSTDTNSNSRIRSPTIRRYTTPLISPIQHEERLPLIPHLDLSSLTNIPPPPRAPRHSESELFNIIDEYGERSLTEDDYQLSSEELLRRLVVRGQDYSMNDYIRRILTRQNGYGRL